MRTLKTTCTDNIWALNKIIMSAYVIWRAICTIIFTFEDVVMRWLTLLNKVTNLEALVIKFDNL